MVGGEGGGSNGSQDGGGEERMTSSIVNINFIHFLHGPHSDIQ